MPEVGVQARMLLRSLSWATGSTAFSLASSLAVALLVPKLLGVEEYGHFQLYLFWTSYAGALTLGWLDGLTLRYGGSAYESVPRRVLATQLWLLVAAQALVAGAVVTVALLTIEDPAQAFVLTAATVAAALLNVRGLPVALLQATYRARDFSWVLFVERAAFVGLLVIVLGWGTRDHRVLVACSIASILLATVAGLRAIRDIVASKPAPLAAGWREITANVTAGLPLLVSNVAGMLVIGVMRLTIEYRWGIVAFSGVSLLLSMAGLVVALLNVVGLVVFPLLRRVSTERLPATYSAINTLLGAALLAVLVLYEPLRALLSAWLPAYREAWGHLLWILPVAVYEGKQALLFATVLKVLRHERHLLAINVAMLAVTVVLAAVTTTAVQRLDAAVISIAAVVYLRALVAELHVGRLLGLRPGAGIALEGVALAALLTAGILTPPGWTFPAMALVHASFLVARRRELRVSLRHTSGLLSE